jgi:hypothetical protein
LAPGSWDVIENHDDGMWVQKALAGVDEPRIALDITGLSNRGVFGALDAVSSWPDMGAMVVYSEPSVYWPRAREWERFKKELAPGCQKDDVADWADQSEWLYSGRNFHVELIPNHEGYDVAGSTALIAFLPFKRGRLAAVMSHAEYSEYVFIAGRPRRPENGWRLEALKEINSQLTKDWPVDEMSTFGYRDALKQLSSRLFSAEGLASRCDVHVAPLGSKLQTVGCWALSRITGAITMVTGIPGRYFPKAYSDGIGTSWVFPFTPPRCRER